MAEAYQSTDKTSIDTNPNTPRLIYEGGLSVSGFGAFDGGYMASTYVDITQFNQVKAVYNELGPVTLKVEVYHVVNEGSEYTFFNPVPFYRKYDNAGVKTVWSHAGVLQQVNIGDDTYVSRLFVDYWTSANTILDKWSAYYTQNFRYKIWSTIF